MNGIKPTPLPWHVDGLCIVGKNASLIGKLFPPDEDISSEEHGANIKLIEGKDKIIVEVRGGVAYCDDERVEIIDYDNC